MKRIAQVVSVVLAAYLVGTVAHARPDVDKRAAMEKKIADRLVDKLGDDARGIRVTVVGNKATLTGEVTNHPVQELAEEVALSVDGIEKVSNQVKAAKGVKFGAGLIKSEGSDTQLEIKVKDVLGNEIGKYAKDVEVEVAGGWASLRGKVPDKARRDLALKAVAGVKGVTKVVDLLRIKA